MEFFKNLYKKYFGKKCTDAKNCTTEPCCKVEKVEVAPAVAEAPIVDEVKSGLPIENYIPQVETESKEVITMSPVSVVETPATANELSPAEKVEKKKTTSPSTKKKKPAHIKAKAKKTTPKTSKKPKAE